MMQLFAQIKIQKYVLYNIINKKANIKTMTINISISGRRGVVYTLVLELVQNETPISVVSLSNAMTRTDRLLPLEIFLITVRDRNFVIRKYQELRIA